MTATDEDNDNVTQTFTITVLLANTAPTSADINPVVVNRDIRTAIPLRNLPFSDVDGDTLHAIKIVTLPGASAGTLGLVYTGVYAASSNCISTITPITAGQEILNVLSKVLYFCPKSGFTRTTFRFKVIDSRGRSSSQAYTATLVSSPGQVKGLQAEAGSGYVLLRWTNPRNPAITSYEYRQKTVDNNYSTWTAITGANATTTLGLIKGLTNNTTYTFQVRAKTAGGAGIPSADVSATPVSIIPAKPTGFQVLNLGMTDTPGENWIKVRVLWDDPKDPSIIRYEVEREFSGLLNTWLRPLGWSNTHVPGSGPTTTSAEFDAGSNQTQYAFRVRAVNTAGNGPLVR